MNAPRFHPDANDAASVVTHFRHRARQWLHDDADFTWSSLVTPLVHGGLEWGAETRFHDAAGTRYVAVYVYASARGRGHLRRHVASCPPGLRYLTSPGCGSFDALARLGADPALAAPFTATPEYRALEAHQGDPSARGLIRMDAVDEGLFVLRRRLGASEAAQRAFCLRPLVSDDAALAHAFSTRALAPFAAEVVLLAMEYRHIENRFLESMDDHPGHGDPARITRSPLLDVDHMLIADKVQKAKDLRLHHAATHRDAGLRSRHLRRWLGALGVEPREIDVLCEKSEIPDGVVGAEREA